MELIIEICDVDLEREERRDWEMCGEGIEGQLQSGLGVCVTQGSTGLRDGAALSRDKI